ncbi:hypothetical protein [Paraburkholderia ferrariae]|uniref:hypothetical protein n=1 Tax=Paraburkholderia ferrariae TaxID=386056 RepID=UPI00047F9B4E|nr:hypothetical protein [Paraburkholderia ferrariae]
MSPSIVLEGAAAPEKFDDFAERDTAMNLPGCTPGCKTMVLRSGHVLRKQSVARPINGRRLNDDYGRDLGDYFLGLEALILVTS